ncbi:MAG: GNAT family N-acetyltransferase [Oscillospiraceae bacterium]
MIKQVFSADIALLGHNIIGGKIASAVAAYGTGYDFCRLYRTDSGGHILAYNGTMLADGNFDPNELSVFAKTLNPDTIELSSDITLHIGGEYKRIGRTLFELIPKENDIVGSDVKQNALLDRCFDIISAGFGITDRDPWYVDISHRIRHGVSDIFLFESTTVTKLFDYDGMVFLSHIATAPEARGKGTARRMLYYLCGKLSQSGKRVFLYARDERRSFYEEAGFIPVGYDYFYEK